MNISLDDINRVINHSLQILGSDNITDARKIEIVTEALADWKSSGYCSAEIWLALD